MPLTLMKAGSGKLDVMTGPFENARFVRGACEEKGAKERERRSAWKNIMQACVGFVWAGQWR